MEQVVRIGTRGSKLALYQANNVKQELKMHYPDIAFEIVIIKTKGDKILDVPLSKVGDKGLFTKELEIAILKNEIDMAVHSLKDLPTTFPEGMKLGAVLKRGDMRDALISTNSKKINSLTSDDVIATSSLRRKAQLLNINKDLKIVEIRGNVNTRIRRMEEGYCNILLMAAAGLQRLEMNHYISELIDPDVIIPACGQGAIAVEISVNNPFIEEIISKINDKETLIATNAERAFLKTLEGGCQIPVGSYSQIRGNKFCITGFISETNGSRYIKDTASSSVDKAEETAVALAKKLYNSGGKEILESIRKLSIKTPHEKISLHNKVIISTRMNEPDDLLADMLKSHGATVHSLPMIDIVPANINLYEIELFKSIQTYNWIFFTSKNGVAYFFKHLIDIKGNTEIGKTVRIAVIGGKTAAELDYYGYKPDFICTGNTSEDFLEQFYKEHNPKNQRLFLSLGNLADDTLVRRLSKDNKVKKVVVYNTIKPKQVDANVMGVIEQNMYDLIIFASPSAFQNFCTFCEADIIKNLKIASIGNTTSKAIRNEGIKPVLTSKKATAEGLCEAITAYYKTRIT